MKDFFTNEGCISKCEVSVILPVYNRADTICTAIDSVLAQSYKSYEIILVDDGSEDNLKEILLRYGDKVTYIYQKNSGPSAARNNGIRNANGKFIAFLDSDDAWLPLKLEKQIEYFYRIESLGLIGTGYFICDENLCEPANPRKVKMARTAREEILIHNIWPTPSVVVRRSCFDTVGMFNENMRFAEDWEMWIRIAQDFPIATLEEPLVYIRKHSLGLAGSANNQVYNFKIWKDLILFNRKKIPFMSFVTYRKAMSFYFFNLSYIRWESGKKMSGRWCLLISMIYYPVLIFNLSKLSLIKRFRAWWKQGQAV